MEGYHGPARRAGTATKPAYLVVLLRRRSDEDISSQGKNGKIRETRNCQLDKQLSLQVTM